MAESRENEALSAENQGESPEKRTTKYAKSLVGERFGRWTVVRKAEGDEIPTTTQRCTYWIVHCECGNDGVVRYAQLTTGGSRSCGCLIADSARRQVIDLTGRRIGRLQVLGRAGSDKWRAARWRVRCDCGTEKVVRELSKSRIQSCGCLQREAAAEVGKLKKTHGDTGSPEYISWVGMIGRCENVNNHNYHNWGGRGVKIYKPWRDSYENFLAYVGRRPGPEYSIDRYPDKSGDYCPGNVRWATPLMQANNQRTNVPVTVNGKHFPSIAEAARVYNISHDLAKGRLRKGWSPDLAFTVRKVA